VIECGRFNAHSDFVMKVKRKDPTISSRFEHGVKFEFYGYLITPPFIV